tara:strand:+ start:158 stop:757 length:600 start_codon:yes stop_codon:yes gene_type:complete
LREIIVPARCGRAQKLKKGDFIKIVNTYGRQVVDTWAFNSEDFDEHMSMEHTRSTIDKMMPDEGEAFLTNKRRKILRITEDKSPGIHDTLNAACDVQRYNLLGFGGYHDNCTDNLIWALKKIGYSINGRIPCPFNMFQNRPWGTGKQLYKKPPEAKPGDYLTFKAEMNCIVVLSACPQDMNPTNGGMPKDVHYLVGQNL